MAYFDMGSNSILKKTIEKSILSEYLFPEVQIYLCHK